MNKKNGIMSWSYFCRLFIGWAVIFLPPAFGQAWVRQNPLPVAPSVYVYGVCVVDTQTACVMGQGGQMAITGNNGLSWTGVYPGTPGDLNAASFVDSRRGWVAGDSGFIARTADGGAAWETQNSGTKQCLQDVQFIDSLLGYAVGDTGTILKTQDGGSDWSALTGPATGNYLSLCFINADTGWISGVNVIARTDDGGATWTQQGPTNSRYPSIHFTDKDTGWAAEAFGAVYKTTNGGANWAMVYNFPTADLFWLYDLCFTDTRNGWAAGAFQVSGTNNDGRIMVTRDGGATWSRQVQSGQTLLRVAFCDTLTGWAAGINGVVLKTKDGGAAWQNAVQGPVNDLYDVFFAGKSTGWAVGGSSWDSTLILHTVNGGSTWTSQISPVKKAGLRSVFFVDSLTGWAAGQDMTMLRTTDGGAAWTGQSGGTTDLQCVHFTDADHGWAVGGNSLETGVARKTQNGGNDWQSVTVPTTAPLNDVFFLNPDTGWIAGARGTVLRTYNAGLSFTDLSDSVLGTLVDARFFTADEGWVAGSNGVFATLDGGATWQRRLGAGTNLGACFVDPQTIYLVTGSPTSPFPGHIYRTIDAGVTWQTQFIQNGVLWSGGVHFEDANTGWVVSGGGTILHTARGGGPDWTGIMDIPSLVFNGVKKASASAIRAIPVDRGIRFLVEDAQAAELKLLVYDPLGRPVWSHSGRPERGGGFSCFWSCAHIPSGLYLARVRQGNREWNGRVILLK